MDNGVIGSGGGGCTVACGEVDDDPNWKMYMPIKFTPESMVNVNPFAFGCVVVECICVDVVVVNGTGGDGCAAC